jgi:hypothetical protein
MEIESTEGSTSSVAVVGTGEAIMCLDNPQSLLYDDINKFNQRCRYEICVYCYY